MKKLAALILALLLLASCGAKEEQFPGQNYVSFPLEEVFTVNVSDDARQYVRCAITLELQDETLVADLTAKQHRINGYITDAISMRTTAQVRDPNEKAVILTEIVAGINREFNTESVMKAYFTEFTTVRQ